VKSIEQVTKVPHKPLTRGLLSPTIGRNWLYVAEKIVNGSGTPKLKRLQFTSYVAEGVSFFAFRKISWWIEPVIRKPIAALLFSISLFSITSCAHSTPPKAESKKDIWVVGTLHRLHLKPEFKYSLKDLSNLVTSLHPDLICGEVVPAHLKTPKRGFFPPEQRLVEYLAREIGAQYIPSDWRASPADYNRSRNQINPETQRKFDEDQQNLIRETIAAPNPFVYLHSSETQIAIRKLHDDYIAAGTESADGFWITRNTQIVELCHAAIEKHQAKRVLVVFGVDHKYAIEAGLKQKSQNYVIQPIPSPSHSPLNEVPESVLNQWNVDRDDLRELANSTATSTERQEIEQSGRIKELGFFIDSQNMRKQK